MHPLKYNYSSELPRATLKKKNMAPPAGLEPAIFGLGDRRLAIRPQGLVMTQPSPGKTHVARVRTGKKTLHFLKYHCLVYQHHLVPHQLFTPDKIRKKNKSFRFTFFLHLIFPCSKLKLAISSHSIHAKFSNISSERK